MTDDRVTKLAEDLVRLTVNATGGFPVSPPDWHREIVRVAREVYSEIDHPTPRPEPKKATARAEEEDEEL